MTDLEYIVKQAKKFYYVQWDEAELRKCVDMLPALEHDELVRLFNCKWIKKVLKEAIFAYSGDTRSPIPVISVHSVGNLQYRRQS